MTASRAVPGIRTPRAMCLRCERPESVCYCHALVSIETRSRIVILQHPREQGMPIGTAHMAQLCLPQASLHVGLEWDDSDVLREACGDPERPPVLLYPGRGARDILREPPAAPVTLIVVDGTWSQAGALVRDNPRLASLPRYAFHAPEPSQYRIRREPRAEYVSTIEALMHVLAAIEGAPERFRPLLRPLHTMVDAQLAAQERAPRPRPRPRDGRPRPRLAAARRLPREIVERWDDLVLVFGDANAWPYGTPQHGLGDELVHWVARRPSTRESFTFVVAPRNPLAPGAPRHTELPAQTLLAGGSPTELLAAFAAFTRGTDVIASWGHHGLRMFKDCGGALPGPFLDLRGAARKLTNAKNGTLEDYAAATAAPAAPPCTSQDGSPGTVPPTAADLLPGRAGRRLGMLARILDAWRALAGERPERPGRAHGVDRGGGWRVR